MPRIAYLRIADNEAILRQAIFSSYIIRIACYMFFSFLMGLGGAQGNPMMKPSTRKMKGKKKRKNTRTRMRSKRRTKPWRPTKMLVGRGASSLQAGGTSSDILLRLAV